MCYYIFVALIRILLNPHGVETMNSIFKKSLLALSVAGLVACGGGGSTPSPKPVPTPPPNHPVAGTVLSTDCNGTTLVETIANGTGGSTTQQTSYSTDCGYEFVSIGTAFDQIPYIENATSISNPIDLDADDDVDYIVYRRSERGFIDDDNGSNDYLGNALSIYVLRNDGNNGFTVEEKPSIKMFERNNAVADFNGDGLEDIVSAADHIFEIIDGEEVRKNRVGLLLQTSTGDVVDASNNIPEEVFGDWHGLTVDDIDADGDVDIVVLNLGNPAYVLINDGNANFSLESFNSSLRLLVDEPHTDAILKDRAHSVALLVDLNNDTYPELLLGGQENQANSIFSNTSQTFEYAGEFAVEEKENVALSMEHLDFNGDGCEDVIMYTTNLYAPPNRASWFSGDCAGNLTLVDSALTEYALFDMLKYDFDKNGLDDILITGYSQVAEPTFLLLLNIDNRLEKFTGTYDEFKAMNDKWLIFTTQEMRNDL